MRKVSCESHLGDFEVGKKTGEKTGENLLPTYGIQVFGLQYH
jgi:hypothetical protein